MVRVVVFSVAVALAFGFKEPLQQLHPWAPLVMVTGILVAVEAVMWARRRMDAPMTRSNKICIGCQKPRPSWSRRTWKERVSWQTCPEWSAGYCLVCKASLWVFETSGARKYCQQCGYELDPLRINR